MLFFYLFWLRQKYRLYSNRNVTDMKNVYCLAFHPLVLAYLNINNQDYCKILGNWLNLISLLASQMIYCSLILLILIFLVTKAPYLSNSIVYFVKKYISYRVMGLYRLGKTSYLHSLLCKMMLFQFAHGKMITQPTFTPPQTRDWLRAIVCAEIVARGRHMTKQLWE